MQSFDELTIGIEEEYQIVDSESGELTSFVSEFFEHGAVLFRDHVKLEFLQSQRKEICRLRNLVSDIAARNNCRIVVAVAHPFSK